MLKKSVPELERVKTVQNEGLVQLVTLIARAILKSGPTAPIVLEINELVVAK